jgi:hypothetical protein
MLTAHKGRDRLTIFCRRLIVFGPVLLTKLARDGFDVPPESRLIVLAVFPNLLRPRIREARSKSCGRASAFGTSQTASRFSGQANVHRPVRARAGWRKPRSALCPQRAGAFCFWNNQTDAALLEQRGRALTFAVLLEWDLW